MIGQWDPSATTTSNQPETKTLLLLAQHSAEPTKVDDETLQRAILWIKSPATQWEKAFADISDDALLQLSFFYVRAEMKLSGFEAGASSPAIYVFRYLKSQGRKPSKDIVKALKAETNNRFIPHGDVLS